MKKTEKKFTEPQKHETIKWINMFNLKTKDMKTERSTKNRQRTKGENLQVGKEHFQTIEAHRSGSAKSHTRQVKN